MRQRVNPFILAHGTSSGPLMRPLLTGSIAGVIAGFSVFLVSWKFELLTQIFYRFGTISTFLGYVLFGAVMGIIYGAVYRRAANDRQGGWIFGSSAGFIFWMLNPIIWLPWLGRKPIFLGSEALAFLASHVLFGLLLGILFPWLHLLFLRPFDQGPQRKEKR
jgi:hypothetical protein